MPLTAELMHRLRAIVGSKGFLDDARSMAPFLAERRGRRSGRAPLVLLPETTGQVAEIVTACARARVGIVPQGGNTGLVFGSLADESQVLVSLSRLNRVLAVDADNHTMIVQAGCILADAQAAAERHGLLLPLSLAAEGSCQIGGNLSTNAGGTQVLHYGNTRDLTLGLEVVLADGRIWDGLRGLRKDNRGFDLKHLFIGGEGSLGIVTAAVLKLFPRPRRNVTAMVALTDPAAAVALLKALRAATSDAVTTFEYMDATSLGLAVRHLPECRYPFADAHSHHVLMELACGRDDESLRELVDQALAAAYEHGTVVDAVVADSLAQSMSLWRLRESIPEAQLRAGLGIKHDISVPVAGMPEFIRRAGEAIANVDPRLVVVAFGHVGDGNMHFNVNQPQGMPKSEFLAFEAALHARVYAIVDELGGSFSAEHGIGRMKRAELCRFKSSTELDMMRAVKRALDPANIMNPGVFFETGDESS